MGDDQAILQLLLLQKGDPLRIWEHLGFLPSRDINCETSPKDDSSRTTSSLATSNATVALATPNATPALAPPDPTTTSLAPLPPRDDTVASMRCDFVLHLFGTLKVSAERIFKDILSGSLVRRFAASSIDEEPSLCVRPHAEPGAVRRSVACNFRAILPNFSVPFPLAPSEDEPRVEREPNGCRGAAPSSSNAPNPMSLRHNARRAVSLGSPFGFASSTLGPGADGSASSSQKTKTESDGRPAPLGEPNTKETRRREEDLVEENALKVPSPPSEAAPPGELDVLRNALIRGAAGAKFLMLSCHCLREASTRQGERSKHLLEALQVLAPLLHRDVLRIATLDETKSPATRALCEEHMHVGSFVRRPGHEACPRFAYLEVVLKNRSSSYPTAGLQAVGVEFRPLSLSTPQNFRRFSTCGRSFECFALLVDSLFPNALRQGWTTMVPQRVGELMSSRGLDAALPAQAPAALPAMPVLQDCAAKLLGKASPRWRQQDVPELPIFVVHFADYTARKAKLLRVLKDAGLDGTAVFVEMYGDLSAAGMA